MVELSAVAGDIAQVVSDANTTLDPTPLGFGSTVSEASGDAVAPAAPTGLLGSMDPNVIGFMVTVGASLPVQVRVVTTPDDAGGSGLTLAGLVDDLNAAFTAAMVPVTASIGGAGSDRVRLVTAG